MEVAGKIKFRKQLLANTCGHAILEMILKAFSINDIDQEKLIKELPPSKDGISLSSIRKYLNTKGLELESFAAKSKDDISNIPFKKSLVILVTKEEGVAHFILVEKRKLGSLFIHDPAKNKSEWMSINDVKEKWVRVFSFVSFKYIPPIRKNEKQLSQFFISSSKPQVSILMMFLFLSLVSGLSSFIGGYQFRTLINYSSPNADVKILIFISLYFMFALLLQKSINFFMDKTIETVYIKKLFKSYENLTIFSNYLKDPNLDKMALLNSLSDLYNFFYWRFKMTMSFPFKIIVALGSLLGLIYINWEIGALVSGLFVISLLVVAFFKLWRNKKTRSTIELTNTSLAKVGLWIENIETGLFCDLNKEISRSAIKSYKEVTKRNSSFRFTSYEFFSLFSIIISLSTSLSYLLGSYFLSKRSINLEEIIVIISLSISFWNNTMSSLQTWINYPKTKDVFQNINSLKFYFKNSGTLKQDTLKSLNSKGIKLIKPSFYALWGHSGSGKTTLLKNTFHLLKEKENIIFITHNSIITEGTVFSNIMLTSNSFTSEWKKSLSKYNLIEIINEAGLQLEKNIGINGFNISEGQKQVINILRILARNDEIIIIDEGFSLISKNLRAKLFHIVKDYCKDKLLFISSHDDYILNQSKNKIHIQKEQR